MRTLPIRKALVALGLAAFFVPFATQAQTREIISKEVSVGRSAATLRLEFADEDRLELSFDDGSVLVDGDVVGSYEPGGDLDVAWRELMGRAVALDEGPLAEALADWAAPAQLTGRSAEVGREVDRSLEAALRGSDEQVDRSQSSVEVSVGDPTSLVRLLVGSNGRRALIQEALEALEANFRIHVAEDVAIPAGEVVDGNLVVIDGDTRLAGEVDGDVVVVGGTLELLEGSSVSGTVRLGDARLVRNEGTVGGGVRDVRQEEQSAEAELREGLEDEVRADVRRDVTGELTGEARNGRDGRGLPVAAPLRRVMRSLAGVLESLLAVFVLALVGAVAITFGGDKVDVIAETARRAPGRAAVVGLAGTVLLVPAWIIGAVVLVLTIVGIPVAIAWLPLFPLAVVIAGVVGYLAVARNAGEWLADSGYPWTQWIRKSNSLITMVGGLLFLILLFVAADVVSMVPFLGFFRALFITAACVITFAAVQVGFGAVLLTRGGRRRDDWSGYDSQGAWETAMRADAEKTGEERRADVGGEAETDA